MPAAVRRAIAGDAAEIAFDRLELLLISLTYVPLLRHAVDLAKSGPAGEQTAAELRAQPTLARRYGLLQLWILVPAAVVVMAVAQARRRRTAAP